ncbi:uncharacterized protein LOC127729455 [Mytilus californianus]|uniref:uncharacterized protein LOC127729455 n=1 Tax=Mytilus californianus TaxID=6549 RepID=UPI0022465845|nr:uncharacterized protein LOC127729455 [Mytilus californianus]
MASSKPVHCGPCKQGKVNTKADIWCYNCDEGLCSICSSHHKRIKSSRDHKTIDIQAYTSYKPPTASIKTECDTHRLQFKLYCPCHLMPCCDECISISHSKCSGITSLASVVEKTKINKSIESVEKDINSITHFLEKLVKNKSGNLKRGEQQCETIKQSISEIRNEINKHLDNLEEKLCKEADTVWRQEKSKLTSLITEIEGKIKNVKEIHEHLSTVTEHTSKLQSFLGVHQIEQKVHQCQRYVEDIENSERVCDVDINIKQNGEVEKILKELQSIEAFGDVNVVKTKISMKRKTIMSREAQIELQDQSSIENMTMNIETRIQIKTKKQISDLICLVDGRVIVVEQYGKVNLLTSDGKLKKQLPIPGKAWSVTQINQDTIAITYPHETAIKIFHLENETVTKVIKLRQPCYGLSFSNNFLAVGLAYYEILIIDLEGITLKTIPVESESNLCYVVYCNDRVIYNDFDSNAVNCVDESGIPIWQYKQDLTRPWGLCIDTYSNIIVVDLESLRIIVLLQEGQVIKELAGQEDIGYPPYFICFNKNEKSSGFICDVYGNNLTRFNMSYG